MRGFLRGTSGIFLILLLVITPYGVAVEYIDSKKPSVVVDFASLSWIRLRVSGALSPTASRSGWMSGSTCTTATAESQSGGRLRSPTSIRPSRYSSRPMRRPGTGRRLEYVLIPPLGRIDPMGWHPTLLQRWRFVLRNGGPAELRR